MTIDEMREAARLAGPVDLERVQRAMLEIIAAVGDDPAREGLVGTPERVARVYAPPFEGMRTGLIAA